MVTRLEVLELVDAGVDYDEIGDRLRISPGLAFMIATGQPADGSDATGRQDLAHRAPVENPTHHDEVQQWINARVQSDAQMRAAHKPPAPPELGQSAEDMDVAAVLARDHHAIHTVASQLTSTPTKAKGAAPDQIEKRGQIIDVLREGLTRHEAAEEMHFWPYIRRTLGDGETLADAHAQQENEARATFAALAACETGSDRFEELVTQLQKQLRKHVAFEDRVLLMLRDTSIEDDTRKTIGRDVAGEERKQ